MSQHLLVFSKFGQFSKIDHIISHKTDNTRYKMIQIIPWLLTDQVFNSNQINRKPTYTGKLYNAILNETFVKELIRKQIKDLLEFNKNEGTTYTQM